MCMRSTNMEVQIPGRPGNFRERRGVWWGSLRQNRHVDFSSDGIVSIREPFSGRFKPLVKLDLTRTRMRTVPREKRALRGNNRPKASWRADGRAARGPHGKPSVRVNEQGMGDGRGSVERPAVPSKRREACGCLHGNRQNAAPGDEERRDANRVTLVSFATGCLHAKHRVLRPWRPKTTARWHSANDPGPTVPTTPCKSPPRRLPDLQCAGWHGPTRLPLHCLSE